MCWCSTFHTLSHVILFLLRTGPLYITFDLAAVVPKIDKGSPHQYPIESASGGSRTFKIGGSEYILAGYSFTITCKVLEGVPEPRIIWLKDDIAIEGTDNLKQITIPVSIDDPEAAAGRYTCKATNVAGNDEAYSQLQLKTG